MGVAMVLMATPATPGSSPRRRGRWSSAWRRPGGSRRWSSSRRRGESLGSAIGVDRCTAHPAHLFVIDAAMVVMYLAMAGRGSAAPPARSRPRCRGWTCRGCPEWTCPRRGRTPPTAPRPSGCSSSRRCSRSTWWRTRWRPWSSSPAGPAGRPRPRPPPPCSERPRDPGDLRGRRRRRRPGRPAGGVGVRARPGAADRPGGHEPGDGRDAVPAVGAYGP